MRRVKQAISAPSSVVMVAREEGGETDTKSFNNIILYFYKRLLHMEMKNTYIICDFFVTFDFR